MDNVAIVQQTFLQVNVTIGTPSLSGEVGSSPTQFADGSNTVKLSGYRITADISKNGPPAANSAEIRIYGLDESIMNSLSRVGQIPTALKNNIVTVLAGTDPSAMALAFAGVLTDAWPDYEASPEVAFNITALTGMLGALKPILPSSYPGSTDVAIIMKNLAGQMGYTLENNGVTGVMLSSPYLPGTARQQALAAADAAQIFVYFEDDNGIMAIFPRTGARATAVPLITPPPDGNMIGYPSYVGPAMIRVRSGYNPAVRFGGFVLIQSSLTLAEGQWRVIQLTHNLSCQMPDGDWSTEIIGNFLSDAS
jgi:hypothetical protein